jgi:hypothetical protein
MKCSKTAQEAWYGVEKVSGGRRKKACTIGHRFVYSSLGTDTTAVFDANYCNINQLLFDAMDKAMAIQLQTSLCCSKLGCNVIQVLQWLLILLFG